MLSFSAILLIIIDKSKKMKTIQIDYHGLYAAYALQYFRVGHMCRICVRDGIEQPKPFVYEVSTAAELFDICIRCVDT